MARRTKAPPARERLALNLRERRRALGISQELLGELAGLHRTYVGGIERGERNVTIDNIERLAEALNADVVELLNPVPAT
jgi:transcriptional regulator with XRE-family HTH domain